MTTCTDPRFIRLVLSFPVLSGVRLGAAAPGVSPDGILLDLLDAWAAHDPSIDTPRPFPGRASVETARFVLHLFNSQHGWRCGKFDLFRALRAWDDEQRGAWQAWAAEPFLP